MYMIHLCVEHEETPTFTTLLQPHPSEAQILSFVSQKVVTALDKTWHPEHFFCAQCGAFFGPEGTTCLLIINTTPGLFKKRNRKREREREWSSVCTQSKSLSLLPSRLP